MELPLVQVLMCLLLPWICATYLQFPANSTTCLGATTEFGCASTDAQTIFYYVNNTPAVSLSAQGITVSAPISNGSITLVKLYVAGTSTASVSKILCTILFTNGSFLNSTSYLTTQGPSAVANLAATPFNATSIRLAWTPPTNAQSLSALPYMYVVEVCRNGSGALLYNVTVTVPQLDIAIPDPCDQYQATVTVVCGTTASANNISLKFFGECILPGTPPFTMIRDTGKIIGGVIGGVAFIVIIITIIIIICILKRKRVLVKAMVYHAQDEADADVHREHVSHGISQLEDRFVDIQYVCQGDSGVVVKAKRKYGKDKDYYAIKIVPVDKTKKNITVIDALTKLKQEAGTVRYIEDWDEPAPSDWHARFPWNKFPKSAQLNEHSCMYLVMDFCDGGNLESWLPNNIQRFPVYVIFEKILTSLEAIHRCGIYHQDLSLQNIFVASIQGKDNDFLIKIGGFINPKLDESDVHVLKVDILSLGYVLMQLIYCKGHNGKLPNTLPRKFKLISEGQSDQPIQILFNMLHGTCTSEETSVIELLCGNNLCGDGISDLKLLRQSTEYETWKKAKN